MLIVAWILVGLFASVSLLLLFFWSRDRKRNVLNHDDHTPHKSTPIVSPVISNSSGAQVNQHFAPVPVDDDRTILFADDRTIVFSDESASRKNIDPLEIYPYLTVVDGPDTGNIYPLPFDLSSVGRNEGNDIVLTDGTASRHHFEIVFARPHFMLRDTGSTNGTFCNSKLVQETVLEFGDEIDAAESKLVFSSRGFELVEQEPAVAIAAFENYLAIEPDFLLALKNLAFLLERDIRRKEEAGPLWKVIARLENQS